MFGNNMIKVFITSAVNYGGAKHSLPPVGPLYIATVAKQKGCQVFYQDAYLKDISLDDFKNQLLEFRPDLIGISLNAEDRLAGIETARAARKVLPKALIVVGGPFPTMAHREIIEKLDFVDLVVRHEGERQIAEIIDSINQKKDFSLIKGITYRDKKGQVVINPDQEFIQDLDALPMPDFSFLEIDKYKSYIPEDNFFENMDTLKFASQKKNIRLMASLIFSRGCPYNCIFCSAKGMWQRHYRIVSPEKALEQIRFFVKKGVFDFVFQDDHLLVDKEWFFQFSEGLKRISQEAQEPIRFACSARIDALDEETAERVYQSGGRMITVGIENLSSRVLKLMNKRITVEQTWRALEILRKNKIVVRGGVLIETPGEKLEDITENIKEHARLRKYIIQPGTFAPLKIYPGSPLEEIARKEGRLDNFSWVENYYNGRNHLLSSLPHVPIYENLPHEKVLPHLITESLFYRDHYLSRALIREHVKPARKRGFFIRAKELQLVVKGVLKYFFQKREDSFLNKFLFFKKVITQREKRVNEKMSN